VRNMIDPNYNNDALSNITIVTAFFDIGRGSWPTEVRGRILPPYQHRGVDQYFEYFDNLAQMKNQMVIVTSPELAPRVEAARAKYGRIPWTTIITLPEPFVAVKGYLASIRAVMNDEQFINMVDKPHLPEYWNAEYVLINFLKASFVQVAINMGHIHTPLAAWIDFGYCRTAATLPGSLNWDYPFDAEKITLFNQRPIPKGNERPVEDIIKTGDVYIQGCHIVGGTEKWSTFETVFFRSVDSCLSRNLIDDDQTFLLGSYLSQPDLFHLAPADPNDWFRIFKYYNTKNHPEIIY
jgi:protein YibB